MPELPEVETVRRGLAPVLEGGCITRVGLNRPDLRFPFPAGLAERLTGERVIHVGRRAKYLLLELSGGRIVVSHLGMSGSWRIEEIAGGTATPGRFHHPKGILPQHDHVTIEIGHDDGRAYRVLYNDPRRFGFLFDIDRADMATHPHFARLGVEPTGNSLDPDHLATRFAGRKAPLKAALLDQHIIAGLGNIYVCEALWRARLSPRRQARTLVDRRGRPTERLKRLTGHIRDVIDEAIEAGGSSLRDHRQADGSLGYFQHSFAAYDREGEPCAHQDCPGTITRIVQSGRSTFHCPACQT